jgi:hypothetical protein
MSEFVALYRGRTVSEAELVAVSAEPRLVRRFVEELLGKLQQPEQVAENAHKRETAPALRVTHGE